ncbi:MAG: transposase [Solirubrobacterales bacterium]
MPRGIPYPPEFKRDAVTLARTSEKSVIQLAEELGVSPKSLRNWINQADIDAALARA